MLFISDGRVHKRLCEGKYERGENLYTKTTVTAEQHRLNQ